jgi:hypothetical protein
LKAYGKASNIADKFMDAEGKKMDKFMEHFGKEIEEHLKGFSAFFFA